MKKTAFITLPIVALLTCCGGSAPKYSGLAPVPSGYNEVKKDSAEFSTFVGKMEDYSYTQDGDYEMSSKLELFEKGDATIENLEGTTLNYTFEVKVSGEMVTDFLLSKGNSVNYGGATTLDIPSVAVRYKDVKVDFVVNDSTIDVLDYHETINVSQFFDATSFTVYSDLSDPGVIKFLRGLVGMVVPEESIELVNSLITLVFGSGYFYLSLGEILTAFNNNEYKEIFGPDSEIFQELKKYLPMLKAFILQAEFIFSLNEESLTKLIKGVFVEQSISESFVNGVKAVISELKEGNEKTTYGTAELTAVAILMVLPLLKEYGKFPPIAQGPGLLGLILYPQSTSPISSLLNAHSELYQKDNFKNTGLYTTLTETDIATIYDITEIPGNVKATFTDALYLNDNEKGNYSFDHDEMYLNAKVTEDEEIPANVDIDAKLVNSLQDVDTKAWPKSFTKYTNSIVDIIVILISFIQPE